MMKTPVPRRSGPRFASTVPMLEGAVHYLLALGGELPEASAADEPERKVA